MQLSVARTPADKKEGKSKTHGQRLTMSFLATVHLPNHGAMLFLPSFPHFRNPLSIFPPFPVPAESSLYSWLHFGLSPIFFCLTLTLLRHYQILDPLLAINFLSWKMRTWQVSSFYGKSIPPCIHIYPASLQVVWCTSSISPFMLKFFPNELWGYVYTQFFCKAERS